MSKGITLHKTLGVNCHMTVCSRCGAASNELVLLGNNNTVWRCGHCHATLIGTSRAPGKCPRCEHRAHMTKERELHEGEHVPMGLCDSCREQVEAVRAGGVFWICRDCDAQGAIRADAPLAQQVREKLGIRPPEPAGVEFTKVDCPVCTGMLMKGDEYGQEGSQECHQEDPGKAGQAGPAAPAAGG